ncbi:type I polyketide synthase [Pseudomarimonas arenosa]|uniref:Acyltransferase domain-containing protein n=1 Tax=Pseudomarimonas arenosa TaxID=2774145 RepID=A0AAW3ZGW8_9GAMM|nr:type I polyketide synthase [Pseudomarimonas arenosa]MBD8525375.1 acyltransferase domain-containing protein [Pseudomarimonas arenosa]
MNSARNHRFAPVAIVGRACVLPGALSPEALWQAVAAGRDLVQSVPDQRWKVSRDQVLCSADSPQPDRCWSDRGGYVQGFESVWNPSGFAVPATELEGLDTLFHWVLHCARLALAEAKSVDITRSGAVFGNLGFPSEQMAAYAESVWTGRGQIDPRNRFMASGAADLLQRALRLGVGSHCLDAACASSLYALKLACDRLQEGSADLMLAGAVQRADDLFLHQGFAALNALSRSGRSRPFHRDADGLLPAEGAAFFALKRLQDARRDGDTIHGVIRGIGLSNDGRGKGLLVPDEAGQRRAIRSAFQGSGLIPSDVAMLECHATGTTVGDATELRSTAAEYAGVEQLPIGSLKSNLGHLITTAGAAGLIKVLEAMRAGERPPTLHVDQINPSLANTPFRLLTKREAWPATAPRVAAVSAFGFGGNNAHLLVSEDHPSIEPGEMERPSGRIALVALACRAAGCTDRKQFANALFGSEHPRKDDSEAAIELCVDGLRLPPKDLQQTLPQQLAVLQLARAALDEAGVTSGTETAVYIGMEPDPEVARYGLRWRCGDTRSAQRDAIVPALQSAAVLGCMPNIPANRLNSQFDLLGPGFTVQAGLDSGLVGLQLALSSLRRREVDAAVVGAVDFSNEPVHIAASEALGLPLPAADAAVVGVLKRFEDAERDGNRILAIFDPPSDPVSREQVRDVVPDLAHRFGHAYAAQGLLNAMASVLMLHHRRRGDGKPWLPEAARQIQLELGSSAEAMSESRSHYPAASRNQQLFVFAADDRQGLIDALRADRHAQEPLPRNLAMRGPWAGKDRLPNPTPALPEHRGGSSGAPAGARKSVRIDLSPRERVWGSGRAQLRETGEQARLTIVCPPDRFDTLRQQAIEQLQSGQITTPGIYYRERPLTGGLAFAFTGAGAAYHGMGAELLAQLPELMDRLAKESPDLAKGLDWAYRDPDQTPTALQQLQGASALSQIHADLSQNLLRLQADAWLGYSSGETNALFAADVWRDADGLMRDMHASALMEREIGGRFDAVSRAWGRAVQWQNWSVLAPLEQVRAAVELEADVHVAIIHSEAECIIAGDADGCARVVERIGRSHCLRMSYALAVHVPELQVVEQEWLSLHRRESQPPRSGRLYSSAWGESYEADSERCAQAILQQALNPLDLRPAILRAWDDGIRIFIEHGPGSSYARAIRAALDDRDALVLSLDRKGQGVDAVLHVAAALIAAGVDVCLDALQSEQQPAHKEGRWLRFDAHPAPVRLAIDSPKAVDGRQRMLPAPPLPSVLRVDARDHHALEPLSRGRTAESPALRCPYPGTSLCEAPGQAKIGSLTPPRPSPNIGEGVPGHQPVRENQCASISPARGEGLGRGGEARKLDQTRPVVSPAQQSAATANSTIDSTALIQWRAHQQTLAQLQAKFLRRQAEAHQHFLALRERATQQLLQAAGQGGMSAGLMLGATTTREPRVEQGPAPVVAAQLTQPTQHVVSPSCRADVASNDARPTTKPVEQLAKAPQLAHSPTGPRFSRDQLLIHAGGAISSLFGDKFKHQDAYARQVRMPLPPLLLADRVTGIDAEPDSMRTGRIWTETDVRPDAWYLHHGRMPAGVMIEAGQADLMLISYLGVDRFNRGERVYRLLGCELTYHGDLPAVGETLRFEIELDGHAVQGDVRLMFFHYDCHNGDRLQLSVRKGQAGFFSDQELAESAGCLWSPADQKIVESPQLDPPAVACTRSRFDRNQLEAFAQGDAYGCFGPGFELAQTHTRSPNIQSGPMLLQDRITDLDCQGGPWGRGYLRAELDVRPDHWFFDGHFKNDPCMPGTLMFEGCLQMLAFYLAAGGHTLKRDGWRFQPVPELPYQLQCRGQVLPSSKRLVTEVFVEELIAGPMPTVYADLLCTVDGLKAFHARRVALQLVPDWPFVPEAVRFPPSPLAGEGLGDRGERCSTEIPLSPTPLPPGERGSMTNTHFGNSGRPVAEVGGFRFDHNSLLACAAGRPSQAFGPMYQRFDGPTRVARLPSPPYHFISRIAEVQGPIGVMQAGARVVAEYDLPESVWYLEHNGCRRMPFAVLLEAALQPCGWLSSYVGSALTVDSELCFRNLDGEGRVLAELEGGAGTLRTEVELLAVSATAGMIIETFRVRCSLDERSVYELNTVFGFFPPEALAAQAGLPKLELHNELFNRPANCQRDLAELALENVGRDGLALPARMLRMIDTLQGYWPDAGTAGLGQLRAMKQFDANDWFFKAHFFQDPVQPGSLGLEALLQLLQVYVIETGIAAGMPNPRFQCIALDQPHQWKYRGQVLPHHKQVHTTLEITALEREPGSVLVVATGSLWADGQRIYEASGLAVRVTG